MDPTALVSRDLIDSANEFLKRLPADGLTASGALWAQVVGDEKPYLYVLTPNIETEGAFAANMRLGTAVRAYLQTVTDPFRWFDPFAVRLIGASDDLGRALHRWYQYHTGSIPMIYRDSSLHGVALDGAYIYPAKMFAAPAAAQTA